MKFHASCEIKDSLTRFNCFPPRIFEKKSNLTDSVPKSAHF